MRGPATGRKQLLYGVVVLLGLFAARVAIAKEGPEDHHRRRHRRNHKRSPPTSPRKSASDATCPGDNARDSLAVSPRNLLRFWAPAVDVK